MAHTTPEHTAEQEREEVDLESRVTHREARAILDVCGVQYKDYAKALKLTPNALSSRFWLRPNQKLSLLDMDKLKEICTEKNFYLALKEVRRNK